jgi:hypothetical protein
VVGPAGAGKTVLACQLAAGTPSTLWGQPLRSLVTHTLRALPRALACRRAGVRLSWEALTQMARHGAVQESTTRMAPRLAAPIVFDEGPLFGLAWFQVFHPELSAIRPFADWRARTLASWRDTADVVVYLDGPDDTLSRRIRNRKKPHMVKHRSDAEIAQFNALFREAFGKLLAELSRGRGPRVLHRWSDGTESPQVAARGLWATLKDAGNGH